MTKGETIKVRSQDRVIVEVGADAVIVRPVGTTNPRNYEMIRKEDIK